jgi:hypothetical protein
VPYRDTQLVVGTPKKFDSWIGMFSFSRSLEGSEFRRLGWLLMVIIVCLSQYGPTLEYVVAGFDLDAVNKGSPFPCGFVVLQAEKI